MMKENRKDQELVRSFICMTLPASIRGRLERLQGHLRRVDADVGWVKAANIHLTLKFLGDVARSRIELVQKGVTEASRDLSPFEVTVSGTGCFPSDRNPRVLWVGLKDIPQPLRQLQSGIESCLAQTGFSADNKPFSPHLTLGRLRSQRNNKALVETLLKEGFSPESFLADRVIVMQSQLSAGGSIYTPLAEIRFPVCES